MAEEHFPHLTGLVRPKPANCFHLLHHAATPSRAKRAGRLTPVAGFNNISARLHTIRCPLRLKLS